MTESEASGSSLTPRLLAAFQLEKKLKAQIDAWECEQGRDFLVNGLKFLQYVEEQWEQQRAEKEREKQARVSQPALSLKWLLFAENCFRHSLSLKKLHFIIFDEQLIKLSY